MQEREDYDLNGGISTTLLMIQGSYRDHAKVELHLADILPIRANGSEMNQVLLSVVINAVQAIKERYQAPDQGIITITTRMDGYNVVCEIADNGVGIPEDIAKRVFEPFFTTKPPGHGTGLGLSVAHDAVTKMDGEIRVESVKGVGTKISILLPWNRKD